MTRLRTEALERFPELGPVIASADNVMAIWIELHDAFCWAYQAKPRDESLISRIYSFADWCVSAPREPDAGNDPLTAVTVVFYEHIPKFPPARDDMPRWFRHSEIVQNRPSFSRLIGEKDYNELVGYMVKNQHFYQPRKASQL